uniref:hypothetical protein n=1 Tax=Aliarcobacter sp. TaxID=2321116 RepID=UPI00404794AD
MSKVNTIVSNTGEDFVDELVSNIVYRETQTFVSELKKKMDLKEDSYIDEALESALMTLQFGLMNAVIITVTEYAFVKSAVILTGLIAFIKGRSVVQKAKKSAQGIMSKFGKFGGLPFKMIQGAMGVVVGTQEQNLAIAKMTNDTSNNLVSAIGRERQNQIHLQNGKIARIDSAKRNLYNTRNKSRDKNMALYLHKFETGTWSKTAKDKKLYFDCTGQDDKVVSFTLDYVNELNKYSNVVKTAKGEIFSKAKLELDMITALGVQTKGL